MDDTRSPQEISFLEIAKTIWIERRRVMIIACSAMLVGLIFAFFSESEFTASSTFVPQVEERGIGNLGGLASIAGISLGSAGGSSEIPPALYPRMIKSVEVKRELLQVPITFGDENSETTYSDYYESHYSPGVLSYLKRYTIGLPGLLLNAFRHNKPGGIENVSLGDSSLIFVSPTEKEHFDRLEAQFKVTPNEGEGIVELEFSMPEPRMAAQMAKMAQEILQREVIDYKISNAKDQLEFTQAQFDEKKKEFEVTQNKLAVFKDRNQNLTSAIALNQEQKLQSEYDFAFTVYTELAKQVEQAKFQVKKDTPVFSVLQPVVIPSSRSFPNIPLIVAGFTVLGVIVAIGYVLIAEFVRQIKDKFQTL